MSGRRPAPRSKRANDQEDAMSRNHPLIPAKPTEINLDTLPQLFAHNRALYGGWNMSQTPPEPTPAPQPAPAPAPGPPAPPAPPERPDDVSEEEWNALGDPGRVALTRERERRQTAERALAASRARPTPPKADPAPKPADPAPAPGGDPQPPDIAKIVEQAVAAAIKPFAERDELRATEDAANKVRDAVLEAAKNRLHDATDALAQIDLVAVVNDQGVADPEKVKKELDDLVTRKPHLAKVPTPRLAPPGIGGGAPAVATDGEKVKAVLADMQRGTGVRLAAPTPTTP